MQFLESITQHLAPNLFLSLPPMKITIDKAAGFCPGVKHAIKKAEAELKQGKGLSSHGALLHNELEMQRLTDCGLALIDKEDFQKLKDKKVLFRAHGEPPATFTLAKESGVEVIDATCGVVRRLQKQVSQAAEEMKAVNGQVLIYGKADHPEVIGLLGHAKGLGIVVGSLDQLDVLDLDKPLRLFSQTTMDEDDYQEFADELKSRMEAVKLHPDFEKYDTICKHVSNRIPSIKKFAAEAELLIFVSGKASSNGKKLFNICSKVNPATYFISGPDELKAVWFDNVEIVGISGAASTPQWLMEDVARKIAEINGCTWKD
jgi:4-hydroxy-3-methylbut-2-enyl diphosphate reductase